MGQIDWLAVAVAVAAAFALGGFWFGPLFGRAKIVGIGSGVAAARARRGRTMGTTLVMLLVSAIVLGHVFARLGPGGFVFHLMVAGGIAVGFVVPALWASNAHVNAPGSVTAIDAGYWILAYLAMGAAFALV